LLALRAIGEPQLEPNEGLGTALVEANSGRSCEQTEPDRTHTRMTLRHDGTFADEPVDPRDRTIEERQVALAECTRWEVHGDTAELLLCRRFAGKVIPVAAENGVRALGLAIEEEALQLGAEALLHCAREVA